MTVPDNPGSIENTCSVSRRAKPCPHRDDKACSVCVEVEQLRAENKHLRAMLSPPLELFGEAS